MTTVHPSLMNHDDDEKVEAEIRLELPLRLINELALIDDEEDGDEEEEDDDDDEEDDLTISLRFHDSTTVFASAVSSCITVGVLMDHIHDMVRPRKGHNPNPEVSLEIREGAMLIYQGKDLCRELPSSTLQQIGMSEKAYIFVIYPGPFLTGAALPNPHARPEDPFRTFHSGNVPSSDLLSLVQNVRTATQAGIPIKEFLDKSKESSNKKIIFVAIPISDGIDLLISVKFKLTDKIDYVKQIIRRTILRTSDVYYHGDASLEDEEFDLYLDNIKLESGLVLSDYSVEEYCEVKVSRRSNGIDILVPLKINHGMLPKGLNLELSDCVRKVKTQIHQVTGVPPGWQFLSYQNKLLREDYKSLVDFEIRFSFRNLFSWAPREGALELFPYNPFLCEVLHAEYVKSPWHPMPDAWSRDGAAEP